MPQLMLPRLRLQTRMALVFLAMASVLLVGTIGAYYVTASHTFRQQLRERLMATAGTTATLLDGPDQSRLKSELDPAYLRIQALLQRIKAANPDVRYIYTMKLDGSGTWRFVVDATPSGDPDHSALNEAYEPDDPDALVAIRQGLQGPSADETLHSDKYGTWLSGYSPIKDADGKVYGIVGVDISARRVLKEEGRLVQLALFILAVGFLFALAVSFWLARLLTRPVNQLVAGTQRVAEGDLTVRVPQERSDEFGDLARSFNEMIGAIATHREELKETERMSQELATARKIQQAMLPASAPFDKALNIDFYLETSTEVGGDYFDFLPLGDNKLAFVIGDVTGHGVPAALLMAVIKSCLHTQVLTNHKVSEVMTIANSILHQSSFERRFMTFFYSILDTETGRLTYANAGHLYPYLYRQATGDLYTLEMASYPLGVRPMLVVNEKEVMLEQGDVLFFYSDGIIEAKNEAGEEFGFERLEALIRQHGHRSAETVKAKILESWKAFVYAGVAAERMTGPMALRADDDVTIVVVKYAPNGKGTQPFPLATEV
ncbi:MAG TPA: SpoIIE family protein phosphatase [Stenomitos sp.]